MSSTGDIKIAWTWEEWQRSRKARRAATDRITPSPVRRKSSSSDKRLRAAFGGRRGPGVQLGKHQVVGSSLTDQPN